jgi:hypothetical protein
MIVSISEILSVPQIAGVPQVISILEIVCVPQIVRVSQIVSIPELHSGVSLVPHTCDGRISAIRDWCYTIALRDSCHRVWT